MNLLESRNTRVEVVFKSELSVKREYYSSLMNSEDFILHLDVIE